MLPDFELICHYAEEMNEEALNALLKNNGNIISPRSISSRGDVERFSWPSPVAKLAAEGKDDAVDLLLKLGAESKDMYWGIGLDPKSKIKDFKKIYTLLPLSNEETYSFVEGLIIGGRFKDFQKLWDTCLVKDFKKNYKVYLKNVPISVKPEPREKYLSLHAQRIAFAYGRAGHSFEQLEEFSQKNGVAIDVSSYVQGLATGGHMEALNKYRKYHSDHIILFFLYAGRTQEIEHCTKGYVGRSLINLLESVGVGGHKLDQRRFVYLLATTENPKYRKLLAKSITTFGGKGLNVLYHGEELPLAISIHELIKEGLTYDEALSRLKPELLISPIKEIQEIRKDSSEKIEFYLKYSKTLCQYQRIVLYLRPTYDVEKKQVNSSLLNETTANLIEIIKKKTKKIVKDFLENPTKVGVDQLILLEQLNKGLSAIDWIIAKTSKEEERDRLIKSYTKANIDLSMNDRNPEELLDEIKSVGKMLISSSQNGSKAWTWLGKMLIRLGSLLHNLFGIGKSITHTGYSLFHQSTDLSANFEDLANSIETPAKK
jgi:hypothetical protein